MYFKDLDYLRQMTRLQIHFFRRSCSRSSYFKILVTSKKKSYEQRGLLFFHAHMAMFVGKFHVVLGVRTRRRLEGR